MLFNSIEFLIFLPIVFILYWSVNNTIKIQNLLIVICSYIFYGWWDYRFLFLIAFTTICTFTTGILLEKYQGNCSKQKVINLLNIIINLSILFVFKYFNFFGENLSILLSFWGFNLDWIVLDILLPVGISFYTFQAISYSIDVYTNKIKPTHDIVAFFAFVSFFPQLVAGPIERATNLLPQFLNKKEFSYENAIDGMRQMLWGFFKKMVVADNCATAVNFIFEDYQNLNSPLLIIGGFLFTFQIYGDFSGYSDIAIGTAKLFGIKLMQNFNYPYFSRNIAEFWRRWHISLTTWFRDYIYIPLGGSRKGRIKTYRNTLIIFLISGFWHGANWTFIIWGFYHALLFLPSLILKRNKKNIGIVAEGRILPSLNELFNLITTFVLTSIGWIIFRSENISQAFDYLTRIITAPKNFENLISINGLFVGLLSIMFLVIFEWLQKEKEHALQLSGNIFFNKKSIRWTFYSIIILIILFFRGGQTQFIYFQF